MLKKIYMKKIEKIYARNFAFSYINVLPSDLADLILEVLKSVEQYFIIGYCFSLSSENVLAAYIKTKKQISFNTVHRSVLISKKFGSPEGLRSVLDTKEEISTLFITDINKGKHFSGNFLEIAVELYKSLKDVKQFKPVSCKSFSFSYSNVVTQDLTDLISELLNNLEKHCVVEEYCFSLSSENVLTVYIRTEKQIKFYSAHPKNLILKKGKFTPQNLISVLYKKEFIHKLYLNDVNKGEYFCLYKYMKREIGFVEKIKPIVFERVTGNDFLVSYKNVSDANLRVIYMILVKRFNDLTPNADPSNVRGFCCSLNSEDTLTIYFRTRQTVDFTEFEPEILVINRLDCRPVDIKLVTYPYGTISTLYKNDVYEGHYFTSSLLIEIAIWREFLPKSKRLADAIIPDVEDYEDYELPTGLKNDLAIAVNPQKEDL